MGGKTWSFDEETFFWHDIIPRSPKAVRPAERPLDWEMCARRMQDVMGDGARRKYTKLMMFEHYFQNVSTGHMSPHALAFVNEHKRQLVAEAEGVRDPAARRWDGPRIDQPLTAERSASLAAESVEPLTAWTALPSSDRRLLPRLDTPSNYSSHQAIDPSSQLSSPLPIGAGESWEFPPLVTYPGRLAAYEISPSASGYEYSHVPAAQTRGAVLSPLITHFSVAPSLVHPHAMHRPLVYEPLPQTGSSKRKYGELTSFEQYAQPTRRPMRLSAFTSSALDTLAAAASMDSMAMSTAILPTCTDSSPIDVVSAPTSQSSSDPASPISSPPQKSGAGTDVVSLAPGSELEEAEGSIVLKNLPCR